MQEVDFRFQRLQRQQEEHELFRKLFFGLNGELEGLKLSTTERGGRVRMFIHHRGLILKAIPLEWELFLLLEHWPPTEIPGVHSPCGCILDTIAYIFI